MSQIPQSMDAECPDCGRETLHRTLKGRARGKKRLELVLKCSECGRVQEMTLEAVPRVQVRTVISRGPESERTIMELPGDWLVHVGEDFMHGDERLLVTGIESGGRRVSECAVGDVQTLWAVNFDTVAVAISVNMGGRTRSLVIDAEPEEEFEVGQVLEVDGRSMSVHAIKTRERRLRRGGALARDISRLYCTYLRRDRQGGRG